MIHYAELRQLLAQDKLSKLTEVLQTATARLDVDLNNQVVTIAGRLARVANQLNTGQISYEESNKERTRISAALLDIINQLEANDPAARRQTTHQAYQQPTHQAYQQPVSRPEPQSRPVWPYILLGVVGCIIVLGIIGNMMNGDTGTNAIENKNPVPVTQIPSANNEHSKTKPADDMIVGESVKDLSASTTHSAADLVGNWQTTFSDGTYQIMAQARFDSDGTCFIAAYLNGTLLNSESGTWRLSNNVLYQNMPSGGASSSSLSWINRNQFKATSYEEGITLLYQRAD